jgi:hypothetical protein
MHADRLTIITPGTEPNIALDDGQIRETATHVSVLVPATDIDTTVIRDCPVTVSGNPTGESTPTRVERECTYSGEIVDVSTERWTTTDHRLRLECKPGAVERREPPTVPGTGSP